MAIFAVEYVYDAGQQDVLAANRPDHRAFCRQLHEDGRLLASGPLGSSHALLIVTADDAEGALSLLDADPFAHAGVIETRIPRVWKPVIGPWA